MVGTYSIFGTYTQVGGGAGTSAVQLGIRGGFYTAWQWGGAILVSSTTITTGVWHHFGYTFDGTNHRLYFNGVQESTSIVAPQVGTALVTQYNGYPGGLDSETWTGLVDDARIYTRTLTPNEFQTIHGCRGKDMIVQGLVCRYLFQEKNPGVAIASGDVKDVSGSQQGSLTLTGAGFTFAESTLGFVRRAA
jgi:hypothetical protein